MAAVLAVESTLTDRYQTTVPEAVRRTLQLGKRDKIQFTIRQNGEVVLTRAEQTEENDPALEFFLRFLADDISKHPERLQTIDANLVQQLRAFTADIEVDFNAPLSADGE